MNLKELHTNLLKSTEYSEALVELKMHFDLANAVLRARIDKGLSQEQLAAKIGTKQANISKIEAGLANPTLNVIQKLARVLDINISFTCEEVPEKYCYSMLFFEKSHSKQISKEYSINLPEFANFDINTKEYFSTVIEHA